MLLCTVRECRLPLERVERSLRCPVGHSFDLARSGYINLLQPQDRRSFQPGDSAEAVAARRRIHDSGVTAPLLDAIRRFCPISETDEILDAGCGEGFYTGTSRHSHGIDISVPAIDAAARRYPDCKWVVANADRFIPYPDSSFDVVQSITGRMNPPEFRRVIKASGRLLVALSAPDDLVELRGPGRDRAGRTIADFAPHFALAEQSRATTSAALSKPAVEDLLLAVYRPKQPKEAATMAVTFSLDLLLFRPTSSS